MNGNQGYVEHKAYKSDQEFTKCKLKHSKPKKILLECGEGSGSRTFSSPDDQPFQLAFVTVDTTCLNKPVVLIKFSSLVSIDRASSDGIITVRLQYELFKTCHGGQPTSLGTWMFEQVNMSSNNYDSTLEQSFSFIFCDINTCSDCCDYFVIATPIEITPSLATATVFNGRMSATVQSFGESLNKRSHELECDCTVKKTKYLESEETILACGEGTGNVIFRKLGEPAIQIANVMINTSCPYKTKVLVAFSSIVKYLEVEFPESSVLLQFELFRVCDNENPISIGIWTFEVGVMIASNSISNAFGFNFCEHVSFLNSCEYFVVLTPVEVTTGNDLFDNTMISDSRMTAIAQTTKFLDKYCEKQCLKPKKILLECGEDTGSKIFTSSDDSASQLAHVTVDTTCLSKPIVNIDFTSIVSYDRLDNPLDAFDGQLQFELFRVCDKRRAELLGIWTIERIDQEDRSKVTESFEFTFCESQTCELGCCTYFVTVTPKILVGGEIIVDNSRIAALAQDG
ncbi:DUF4489 domain-containing protein [Wukongibacter baidiensis]|uniref:DUF4489 domain-containing protein n=1 Tax=Wukongibacter baidiensis TaxID=1723361 RepID=UPI003D7F3C1B